MIECRIEFRIPTLPLHGIGCSLGRSKREYFEVLETFQILTCVIMIQIQADTMIHWAMHLELVLSVYGYYLSIKVKKQKTLGFSSPKNCWVQWTVSTTATSGGPAFSTRCWVLAALNYFSPVWFCADPMDCSPPGSSVHGILQAGILEWVAMPSSRGSSWSRDQTQVSYVSCTGGQVLYH